MEKHEERRRSPRFDLSWPISLMSGDGEIARGRTANISRTGAFFQGPTGAPLEAGMTVGVRIESGKPGDLSPILGRARVVRLEESRDGCGVALHFSRELDADPGAERPEA